MITNAIIYRTDTVRRVGASRALGELQRRRRGLRQRPRAARPGLPPGRRRHRGARRSSTTSSPRAPASTTAPGRARPTRTASRRPRRSPPGSRRCRTTRASRRRCCSGDFNSYAQEDPLQVLYDAGWTNLETASGNEEYSYSFSGQVGSLDHVLANDAALASTTGVDVWNINAPESIAFEYSRFNTHPTDFHEAVAVPLLRPRPGDRGPRPRRRPGAEGDAAAQGHPHPGQAGRRPLGRAAAGAGAHRRRSRRRAGSRSAPRAARSRPR